MRAVNLLNGVLMTLLLIVVKLWVGHTVFGAVYNVLMTMLVAYSLSRRDFVGRGLLMFLFAFMMMFFQGGLIHQRRRAFEDDITSRNGLVMQRAAEFITGKRDLHDDASWDAYVDELQRAGVERCVELWQEALQSSGYFNQPQRSAAAAAGHAARSPLPPLPASRRGIGALSAHARARAAAGHLVRTRCTPVPAPRPALPRRPGTAQPGQEQSAGGPRLRSAGAYRYPGAGARSPPPALANGGGVLLSSPPDG